jgi:hypothetical protein
LLERLSEFSDFPARADLIALAAFWHEVVYKTQNCDGRPRPNDENVRDSARLFRRYALLAKADSDAVQDMIMATANHLQAEAKAQYYEVCRRFCSLFGFGFELPGLAMVGVRRRSGQNSLGICVGCRGRLLFGSGSDAGEFCQGRGAALPLRKDQHKMARRRQGQSQALRHRAE